MKVKAINILFALGFSILVLNACGREEKNTEQEIEQDNTIQEEIEEETESSTEKELTDTLKRYDMGDVDGNGQGEYVEIVDLESDTQSITEEYQGRLRFYFNGELIYEHNNVVTLWDTEEAKYIDLDGDGQEEIFFDFHPTINSLPIEMFAVLKNENNEWNCLEIPKGEGDAIDNRFPISIVRESQTTISISCAGLEKKISYDVTRRYEKVKANPTGYPQTDIPTVQAYESFLGDTSYQQGTICSAADGHGIWEVTTGTYQNKPCLIATHGICGLSDFRWDRLGELDVYFDYGTNGNIHVLDIVFREY